MSITSVSPWLFSETEQDVEEQALAGGCLVPSTGEGNVPLTLVLVRHLCSFFFFWLINFPQPHFASHFNG